MSINILVLATPQTTQGKSIILLTRLEILGIVSNTMSATITSIQDFVESVPICQETARLGTVLTMFQSYNCDRLVIVNQKQQPLGLLSLHNFIPHLSHNVDNQINQNSDLGPEEILSQELSREVWASSLDSYLDLLDPIMVLPANLKLEKLWHHLQENQAKQNFAVNENLVALVMVDEKGHFVGLLDSLRLLYHIVTHYPELNSEALLLSPDSPLSLIQILEQLPLPAQICTDSGQLIMQNHLWSQELGQLTCTDNFCIPQNPSADNPGDRYICVLTLENPGASGGDHRERIWQIIKQLMVIPSETIEDNFTKFNSQLTLTSNQQSVTPKLFLAIASDVTEQQLAKRELEAKNADLIQLNRFKDEFLACITHEIKTPLTAVLGLSSLLKNPRIGELNEQQARYAQLIHNSGRQLMTIVNDILDLTRIETGQLQLTLEAISIKEICQACVKQTMPEDRKIARITSPDDQKGENNHDQLEIKVEIEPELNLVIADPLRLRQILVHLLSNAIKFTPSGGLVGLKVSNWDGWIAFTIWDTGIGIPADKQHLIFQKFQQLENPLTRQYEGTGIGLVLTQRLARLHGGDISFISKEGHGSEFTLLLPPREIEECEEWEQVGVGSTRHKLNHYAPSIIPKMRLVLVVETSPKWIEMLTEQITGFGLRVIIARYGTEALEKARRLQPTAILLNPTLHDLSGWDLLTLLKNDSKLKNIPVIITGNNTPKSEAAFHQADAFLKLPAEINKLKKCLIDLTVESEISLTKNLTVLRFNPEFNHPLEEITPIPQCRILESSDLEQAAILCRVWQPHVILLEPINEPSYAQKFIKMFATYSSLITLPLVTQDVITTQLANQIPGLAVFPYFPPHQDPQALLQVIQVAAGLSYQPTILVADLANYTPKVSGYSGVTNSPLIQALIQYLKTAGYLAMIGDNWDNILEKLSNQKIELVLIYLPKKIDINENLLTSLSSLKGFNSPILIWSKETLLVAKAEPTSLKSRLLSICQELSASVLMGDVTITQLLESIKQILT